MAPNAVFAAALLTPSNGVQFIYRATTGGSAVSTFVAGIVGPIWLKISYIGTSVSAYYSPDGANWTQIGTAATITGFSPALVGLAVSAFNNSYAGYATFTNIAPNLGVEFAIPAGSTLDLNLSPAGPVTVTNPSGQITTTQNGEQITFNTLSAITVTDTSSNDVLNVNGSAGIPYTFVSTGTSAINLNSGTTTFATTGGSNISLGALNIANSSSAVMTATTPEATLNLNSLWIAPNGMLNLTNNQMLINYGMGTDPVATIAGYLTTGFNNGTWNGWGINSSTAASNHINGLGYVDSFGQIKVKYTYYGDATLDGKVDGSDYSRIDNAYLADQTNPTAYKGWYNGDFNYDGVINGSDYTLIDNAFNSQGARITAMIAAPTSAIAKPSGKKPPFASSAIAGPAQDILTQTLSGADLKHRTKHFCMEIFAGAA